MLTRETRRDRTSAKAKASMADYALDPDAPSFRPSAVIVGSLSSFELLAALDVVVANLPADVFDPLEVVLD